MDTGPQKESDTPQEARRGRQRKEKKERAKGERHFKTRPERQVGNDSNTDRKKTANINNTVVVVKYHVFKII